MVNAYIGQRVWDTSVRDFPIWAAPHGKYLGEITMKSLTQDGMQGPIPNGYEIFFYEAPQAPHLNLEVDLGEYDPKRNLSAVEISAFQTLAGKTITATKLGGALEQLVLDPALYDASGIDAQKPLRTSRSHGTLLRVRGIPDIIRRPFQENDLAYDATVAVFRADYAALRAAGEPLVNLRKLTGSEMLKIVGRMSNSLAADLLPDPFKGDGWRIPETTVTDDYIDANGTAITSHADSGGNNWVNWGGADQATIQGNELQEIRITNSTDRMRQGTSLSSTAQRVQLENVSQDAAPGTRADGVVWRKDSSAIETAYITDYIRGGQDDQRCIKLVGGVGTAIGGSPIADGYVDNALIKAQHNSSDLIQAEYDGTENYNFTDIAITAGTFCGVDTFGNNAGSTFLGDNFESADLTIPPPPPPPDVPNPEYGQGRAAIGDPSVYGATIVRS